MFILQSHTINLYGQLRFEAQLALPQISNEDIKGSNPPSPSYQIIKKAKN